MQINKINSTQNNRTNFKGAYAKVFDEWAKGGFGVVTEFEVRRAIKRAKRKELFTVYGGRILTRPGNLTFGFVNSGTTIVLTGKDASITTRIKKSGTKLRQFLNEKFDRLFAFENSGLYTTELTHIE